MRGGAIVLKVAGRKVQLCCTTKRAENWLKRAKSKVFGPTNTFFCQKVGDLWGTSPLPPFAEFFHTKWQIWVVPRPPSPLYGQNPPNSYWNIPFSNTNSEKKCGFSVCWSRLVPLLLLIVVGCGWTLWEWGYRKAIKYRFPRANRSLGLLDTPLTSWRYLVILWNVAVLGIWFTISILYDVKLMLV